MLATCSDEWSRKRLIATQLCRLRAGPRIRSVTRLKGSLLLLSAVAGLCLGVGSATPGFAIQRATKTRLVSVSFGGRQGDAFSRGAAMSRDGRYISFISAASNLVDDDTNQRSDAFLYDTRTNTTRRLSVGVDGQQSNHQSYGPSAISGDGRYVAFYSYASNLVPNDTNAQGDIFLRDARLRTTERISVSSTGIQGNGHSFAPAITPDARFVAFYSTSSNLVPGDTNGTGDIFVRDRLAGTTERVNLDDSGHQANDDSYGYITISADGTIVSFGSYASNLVPGDTNGYEDVFVRDRRRNTTERVNVSSAGEQANSITTSAPAMTPDGRFIAYASLASNLVDGDTNASFDVFLRDRDTNLTTRISVGSDGSQGLDTSGLPGISDDGRFVTFASYATNFAMNDDNGVADIFLLDRDTGVLSLISADDKGGVGNGASEAATISGDGRFVAFDSESSNLIHHDQNDASDVFRTDVGFRDSHD